MKIASDKISGTLHYVKGYTEFSGVPAEQEGNYLALKVEYDEDTTVKTTLIGGTTKDKTLPKGDHLLVTRVTNKDTQSIKLVAEKAGSETTTTTYSLTGLTLESDSP